MNILNFHVPFQGAGWNTVHFDMSTVTAQAWPNPGAEWDGNADFKKLVFFVTEDLLHLVFITLIT